MDKYTDMADEQLAMAYVQGDNRAFDLLLERNQSRLFAYIMFVVRDRQAADDIFQETFVKIITKLQLGRYSPTGKFSAWMICIAHNAIMDWFRDRKADRIVEVEDGNDLSNFSGGESVEPGLEDAIVREQVLCDVKRLMEGLPAVQREVVHMRYYQQLPFKEIAQVTGVSIGTALGRMRYALINMRRKARRHGMALQLQ